MDEAREAVVAACRSFGGDALRDVWLFDGDAHERIYGRPDAGDGLGALDRRRVFDNERYGFVTRTTYESLYDVAYGYTVRGFGDVQQFRTFLGSGEAIGVLVRFDADGARDFDDLQSRLGGLTRDYDVAALAPSGEA
jgi:hypothetical protein